MNNKLTVYLLLLVSFAGLTSVLGDELRQKPALLDVQIRVEMQYLIYLPIDYVEQKSWPLMLFLHGSGERGSNLEMVKAHGPPKLISLGKQFPMIVVSPQCPAGETWEPLTLVALLDDLQRKYNVDVNRIYVTGLSMGGYGTWRLAAHIPHRIAAIAPICGGGETDWTERIPNLPVWAFHGANDGAVPLPFGNAMVDALKKSGGNPKFTIYPDLGHDCWTVTYNNPEFYEWLLAQKRPSGE